MFNLNLHRSAIRLLPVVTMLVGASVASAALFERDPSTINLNLGNTSTNVSDPNRSNAALYQGTIGGTAVILGDDFTLGTGTYNISSITVWVVDKTALPPLTSAPSATFTLYGGTDSSMTALSTTYTATAVKFGNQNYTALSPDGGSYQIWAITFTGISWNGVVGGASNYYDFAVDLGNTGYALLSSYAAKSDGLQTGSDGQVLIFSQASPTLLYGSATDTFQYWSNPSDIDVIINGTQTSGVPEPATIGLMSLGLLGLGWKLRRKA